jgi:hypothetical protein
MSGMSGIHVGMSGMSGIYVGMSGIYVGMSGIYVGMSGIHFGMSGIHVGMSGMSGMSEMKRGSVGNVGIAKCECRDRVGSRAFRDLCSNTSAGDGPAHDSNMYQKRERTEIRRQYYGI